MIVTNMEFFCELKGSEFMNIEQRLRVVNNKSVPIEISLPNAIGSLSDAKSITVKYQNVIKIAKIAQLTKIDLIQSDDEISCGNLVVSVNQDEHSMSIEISNLPPDSFIDVSIQMFAYLLNDLYHLYFVIPSIEKYDKNLYPNYKISIQTLTEKIKLKNIKFEYNGKDHTKEINDKTNIEANDVSFQSSLILKMPLKKIEQQCFNSLLKVSDIIMFVDSSISISSNLSSSVINFLNNYGINYRFSIIKYGFNSCALFNKMIEKNQETIDEAERFINVKSSTDLYCDFIDAYTNVFGLGYNGPISKCKKYERGKIKYQALHIEEINADNTIAICFGTFNGNEIITTRKVPTFIIDPILKQDTISFAFRNDFEFVGPFFHNKNEVEYAFNHLMQKIRTYTNESRNQYFVEEPKYPENIDDSQTKSNQAEGESNFRILLQDLKELECNINENETASSSHEMPSSEFKETSSESSVYPQNFTQIKPLEGPNNNNKDNNSNNKNIFNTNKDNNKANKDNNKTDKETCQTHIMKGQVVANSPTKNQDSFISFQIDDVYNSDRTYFTPLNINSSFDFGYLSNFMSYHYDNDNDASMKVSLEEKEKIEKEKIQSAFHEQDFKQTKFSNSKEKIEKLTKKTKKDDKENESKKINNEIDNKKTSNEIKNLKEDIEINNKYNKYIKKDVDSKKKEFENIKENINPPKIVHIPQFDKIHQLLVLEKFDVHDNNINMIQAKFTNSDMPELNREFAGNDLSIRI